MKLIIAGSRHFKELTTTLVDELLWAFMLHDKVTEVVSGGAAGVDRLGEQWAEWVKKNYTNRNKIALSVFNANWNEYGKAAGPIRNQEMAQYADALLLIWDGKSLGSQNMKLEMMRLGKPVFEVVLSAPEPELDEAA